MLDAVEARLESGQPSPGLAAYLNRMGVRYLVVCNDLAPSAQAPMPIRVHQAWMAARDQPVAFFGPIVDRPYGSEVLADGACGQLSGGGDLPGYPEQRAD